MAANALKSIIIVLSCAQNALIQTVIPEGQILKEKPLFLAFCPHKRHFYNAKKIVPESNPDTLDPKKVDCNSTDTSLQQNRCTCGRGNKGRNAACQGSRCPCFSLQLACVQCECLGCENTFGKRSEVQKKMRACRCGGSNAETLMNCKKNRCLCFKNNWSCNSPPVCKCKRCENDLGRQEERRKGNERAPKRETGSAGKLYRFTQNNSFHEHLGLNKKQSLWTDSETIAIFLCEQTTPICKGRYKKIRSLYNAVLKNCYDLILRPKRLKQILFKLKNIHSYDYVYNV